MIPISASATARVLVGSEELLLEFVSGVLPQTTGGKGGGTGPAPFGHSPDVMLAGLATIELAVTDELTLTKKVSVPL